MTDTRFPSADALAQVHAGEVVQIELNNGSTVEANLDTLADLQSKMGDAISEAHERRFSLRSSFLDPGAWGLRRVEDDTKVQWIHPEGFGSLPYGVPVIEFRGKRSVQYRWRRYGANLAAGQADNEEESWRLTFHLANSITLGEVVWHDAEGMQRLANLLLTTSSDDLVMEAALLNRGDPHQETPHLIPWVSRLRDLIERIAPLPAVTPDVMLQAASALTAQHGNVTIAPLHMIDPALCRPVAFPGIVTVNGIPGSTPDIDRALKAHGLVGVATRSQSLRYNGIQRLAVANRVAKKTLGTLTAQEVDTIGGSQLSGQQGWRRHQFALNPTALTFDEWSDLT